MKPIEWEEGYADYFGDGNLQSNPYNEHDSDDADKFFLWLEGFINARKDHIQELERTK